jgi:hypothetical protein
LHRLIQLVIWSLIGLIAGCSGGGQPERAPVPAGNSGEQAKTLPIPGVTDVAEVGEHAHGGHLTWSVPAGWIEETPTSSMRLAQYLVAGSGGDALCLVFYFGPGQGGDVAGNARRWAGQFTQPDGRDSAEATTISELDSTAFPAQLVELSGTFNGGMSATDEPVPAQPGSALLGAIVHGPDAPWFFKLTGPAATISEQRQAFLDLIGSIRSDG